LWQSRHLKVGVLAPNWWQELHCVVPLKEEWALESGPGEICALAEAESRRQAASARNAKAVACRTEGTFARKSAWRSAAGERDVALRQSGPLGTRSSVSGVA
jgi:hypothetical protein